VPQESPASAAQPSAAKRLCVVIDANQWRSSLLLTAQLGAALLHLLRDLNACVGLPEIIEPEIRKHIVKAGEQATKRIADGFDLLEHLMGSKVDCSLPTTAELHACVDKKFDELEGHLVRVPFRLEHAHAALEMVNAELAPNGPQSQQFKDSAIWQALLELSRQYDVLFITADKAFFKGKDPKNGMADNLSADCRRVNGQIRIVFELQAGLNALQSDVVGPKKEDVLANLPKKEDILPTLLDHLQNAMKGLAGREGFALGAVADSAIEPFATEKPGVFAVAFTIVYHVSDILRAGPQCRSNATMEVKGDCAYRSEPERIADLYLDWDEFSWSDSGGQRIELPTSYAYVDDDPHAMLRRRHRIK
jgi:hypothetical protein